MIVIFRGTHKERFDEEGHGKGKEGRSDGIESTGYVQGFKGNDQLLLTKKWMNNRKLFLCRFSEKLTNCCFTCFWFNTYIWCTTR